MRTSWALQIAMLMALSTSSLAATVEYQHPDLTIVAKGEQLDSVLKSLGKAMRIYITVPTGLNPVVNCDIQQQSVKQAFKALLGDMSYSLEWEEGGERLVGLTILGNGGKQDTAMAAQTTEMAVHDSGMEAQRDEMEAQMAAERVAQDERMQEEVARHDAEHQADLEAFLQSKGVTMPPPNADIAAP